ncbi:REP-associated tyrosine transposase [Thiomicrorhabdus aquaedulcis]|uniref:REP-associated tyrosine transposase n=1 Tax=Thiomicrorhabdus aquaedulcis TaxID=2211106 RepID=UPI000FDB3CF1|nr:transposase [Thiomicrorhabdus aquaedulcis]
MGRSRYQFVDGHLPHFVTCTVLHWIPVFTRPETVDILLSSLRFLQAEGLNVYSYVILENHLHMVVESDDLSRDIARFKQFTAKQCLALLQEKGAKTLLDQFAFYKKAHKSERAFQFWQEGCHPEWIQSDEMMRQKIEYIHQNPVKRGYVDLPEHWRYSSARDYMGQAGLLDIKRVW